MMPRIAGRLLISTATAVGCVGLAHAQPQTVPMDHSARIEGVPVACAGVGDSSEDNARWESYPVKLTFARKDGAYLGNEMVQVRDSQGRVLDVHCHAPWVLMGLKPGHYRATARIPSGEVKHISFTVPERGRRSIVLHYATANANPVSNAAYRQNGAEGRYQNGVYENGSNNNYQENDAYQNRPGPQ